MLTASACLKINSATWTQADPVEPLVAQNFKVWKRHWQQIMCFFSVFLWMLIMCMRIYIYTYIHIIYYHHSKHMRVLCNPQSYKWKVKLAWNQWNNRIIDFTLELEAAIYERAFHETTEENIDYTHVSSTDPTHTVDVGSLLHSFLPGCRPNLSPKHPRFCFWMCLASYHFAQGQKSLIYINYINYCTLR